MSNRSRIGAIAEKARQHGVKKGERERATPLVRRFLSSSGMLLTTNNSPHRGGGRSERDTITESLCQSETNGSRLDRAEDRGRFHDWEKKHKCVKRKRGKDGRRRNEAPGSLRRQRRPPQERQDGGKARTAIRTKKNAREGGEKTSGSCGRDSAKGGGVLTA